MQINPGFVAEADLMSVANKIYIGGDDNIFICELLNLQVISRRVKFKTYVIRVCRVGDEEEIMRVILNMTAET